MAQYIIDPSKKFNLKLGKATKKISDLTIPFKLITREWYKGNRSIFDLGRKSRGKYEDLKPATKKMKERIFGTIYPILVASGDLAKSMTDPSDSDSVATIVNKKTLLLGTKIKSEKGAPYAFFLHFGTKRMVARPLILFGSEKVAPKGINKRVKNWKKMLRKYIRDVSGGFTK